ncbi:sulfatase-like hydrolase/transferase [Nitrosopumilus sp.]|uniref:sulfatase family protein n=1 Tax=Nitrosopumilus sp. TaxID=2024843 RepID=UPI00247D8FFB|nr:sulfatase-like hydrolase/transferase [Nitrosopumilus sp.]MCV0430390.1 sulfatase-like hydrolase/transferase [Nitrosopumilus sp.]
MKPNIILILIDSMRADKCFNNKNIQTPNIDLLIKKGIYFKNGFSSSDYTITGYGSIFTGKYPINAGKDGMSYHKIFSDSSNFITILQNNGYHTFATMDSGLTEIGFDVNFENEDKGYDRTSTNLHEGLDKQILDKIKSFSEPWFYLIHLDDLHIPIRVPKEYTDKNYSERYDVIVEKIDSFLGKLIETLDLKNTLIILTSDHGDYLLSEDLPKHESSLKSKLRSKLPNSTYNYLSSIKRGTKHKIKEFQTHDPLEKRTLQTRTAKERYLFDDLIHVPILFSGCGVDSIGPVDDLVRSVDIFPTLMDLLKIPINLKEIDGKSLVPIFSGKSVDISTVYLENTIFETDTKNPQATVGIRTLKYKYFRSLEDPSKKIHLFNLEEDILEEKNIALENSNLVSKMESDLMDLRNKLQKRFEKPSMSVEETKKVEDELKKLGYV